MRSKSLRLGSALVALIFMILLFQATAYSAIIRVKTNGNDAHFGATWDEAKKTVTGALEVATEGDEIWVAKGIYQELIQNKILNEMAVNVALYAGFAGTEDQRDQRDWDTNVTVLDGTNSGTVVTITGSAGPDTRMDGFTITGGNGIHGGGIRIVASAPTIANNIIRDNKTDGAGAGISIWGFKTTPVTQPIITNNTIIENRSINDEGDGAGIAVVSSSPTITHNIIARNEANRNGGGICCWRHSLPLIANNFISANSANIWDVGLGGGGIFASATDLDGRPIQDAVSAPIIINNVVAANGAYCGGGISVIDSILGAATITNNTVVANNGSGIYWSNTSPTISNNIVAFNTWGLEQVVTGITSSTIKSNDVYGNILKGENSDFKGVDDPTGTNGNISVDPMMANCKFKEFHLQPDSPCVDAGSMDAIDPGWTDIDGQNRVLCDGVDIGADESDGTIWDAVATIIHVSPSGNDAQDGLTWSTAKATVQVAIDTARPAGGEVWVAAGTYTEHITLPAFVYLYGGFAGNETDRASRNVAANTAILDGDETPTVVNSVNAGYLVSAVDGFTVQNGGTYTGGIGGLEGVEGRGGGINCRVTSPYITNNIIKLNSLGNPFTAYYGEGGGIACRLSYSVITGNTITENETLAIDGVGGGIYCNRSMPTIEENLITQNHAKYGSGIYCKASSPRIVRNIVDNNEMYVLPPQYFGSTYGAITCWLCQDFLIAENMITENTAAVGAGINTQSCFAGRILNNLIINNISYDVSALTGGLGGGIYCEVTANPTDRFYIVNNTIVGNTATHSIFGEQGGGIALTLLSEKIVIANNIVAFNSSGIWQHPGTITQTPTLKNNCVFNNKDNYINLSAGATDISENPNFVNRGGGNFHLQSISPCIDVGDNNILNLPHTDFEGDPRIIDGDNDGAATVDMGADEFNGCNGDFDGDLDVDGSDLATFAAGGTTITLEEFAADFGRTDCPVYE